MKRLSNDGKRAIACLLAWALLHAMCALASEHGDDLLSVSGTHNQITQLYESPKYTLVTTEDELNQIEEHDAIMHPKEGKNVLSGMSTAVALKKQPIPQSVFPLSASRKLLFMQGTLHITVGTSDVTELRYSGSGCSGGNCCGTTCSGTGSVLKLKEGWHNVNYKIASGSKLYIIRWNKGGWVNGPAEGTTTLGTGAQQAAPQLIQSNTATNGYRSNYYTVIYPLKCVYASANGALCNNNKLYMSHSSQQNVQHQSTVEGTYGGTRNAYSSDFNTNCCTIANTCGAVQTALAAQNGYASISFQYFEIQTQCDHSSNGNKVYHSSKANNVLDVNTMLSQRQSYYTTQCCVTPTSCSSEAASYTCEAGATKDSTTTTQASITDQASFTTHCCRTTCENIAKSGNTCQGAGKAMQSSDLQKSIIWGSTSYLRDEFWANCCNVGRKCSGMLNLQLSYNPTSGQSVAALSQVTPSCGGTWYDGIVPGREYSPNVGLITDFSSTCCQIKKCSALRSTASCGSDKVVDSSKDNERPVGGNNGAYITACCKPKPVCSVAYTNGLRCTSSSTSGITHVFDTGQNAAAVIEAAALGQTTPAARASFNGACCVNPDCASLLSKTIRTSLSTTQAQNCNQWQSFNSSAVQSTVTNLADATATTGDET